jgi:hypothetical protein
MTMNNDSHKASVLPPVDSDLNKDSDSNKQNQAEKDGNTCIALGAGVGVLGTASILATGAACPLCYIIAPGLIGLGALRRWQGYKRKGCKK